MKDIDSLLLPEINLETDDIIMNIAVRKDYSEIKDIDERKRDSASKNVSYRVSARKQGKSGPNPSTLEK